MNNKTASFGLSLLTLLAMSSCGEQQTEKKEPVFRVVTETVSAQSDTRSHSYVGVVEENESVSMSFSGTGTITRIYVDEGQAVSKGQLLAELDNTQAKNALQTAQASATQAEDALKRYRLVYERGSLAEATWVEAQSKVEQARATLKMAQKSLADCRIYAPQSGVVGTRHLSAGMNALPSQPVLSILNISSVKVRCSIPEKEMGSIKADTRTRIKVEAAGVTVEGGRIEKGVAANVMTHTYDIHINVPNKERQLLPGMVASVDIEGISSPSTPSQSALLVPITAVQRNANGQRFVWTISDDNTAHRTIVETGLPSGNSISITSGLNTGDKIVTKGYQKLSEGSKVEML